VKLLFFGDLAATGFGTVTADLGRALIEQGVDVRFVSQNEFGELPPPFDTRTLDADHVQLQQRGHRGRRDFVPPLLRGAIR
jgi:hypothetical protein